jgi:hypothetical protein
VAVVGAVLPIEIAAGVTFSGLTMGVTVGVAVGATVGFGVGARVTIGEGVDGIELSPDEPGARGENVPPPPPLHPVVTSDAIASVPTRTICFIA